jgi:hypothetical protein
VDGRVSLRNVTAARGPCPDYRNPPPPEQEAAFIADLRATRSMELVEEPRELTRCQRVNLKDAAGTVRITMGRCSMLM